jgi:Cu-processing system ATP-binding protein
VADDFVVRIRGLRKSFGNLCVLDDVSLDIRRGSVTAVLGPNASGKSTLIKCVLGLVNPDAGEIELEGESVHGEWRYRSRIGYMMQIARFPENLTVDELFGLLKDIRERRRDLDIELFARYDLGSIGRQRLGTLSGGTRQKINAAIAFLFSPSVLILDEPTVGLDPLSTTIFKDKVRKEQAAGRTVILSSHLVNEVEEMADHVIYLLDGKPFFDGTVTELKRRTSETRLDRALVRAMEMNDGTPRD